MVYSRQAVMRILLLLLAAGSHRLYGHKSEPALESSHAGLFRGSDRYDFALVIAARGDQCFWHFAHQSGNFYLDHVVQWVMGMATDYRVSVNVLSPEGTLITSSNQIIGEITFQTEVTGFYQICLGNHNNQFGALRVFVNFGVVYEGVEENEKHNELNRTLVKIQESTLRLQSYVFHMWRHYSYARSRRGADHYLLQSNLSYVTWWSFTQTILIILSGCLQLLFIRRLFSRDPHKTRC